MGSRNGDDRLVPFYFLISRGTGSIVLAKKATKIELNSKKKKNTAVVGTPGFPLCYLLAFRSNINSQLSFSDLKKIALSNSRLSLFGNANDLHQVTLDPDLVLLRNGQWT